jgi:DNA ligase-1
MAWPNASEVRAMKPMLASDYEEGKIRFPVLVQPKIDGVRAVNLTGDLTGRSLKRFKNQYISKLFSHPDFVGFDGEMAAESEVHPALCRITTSALSTITGTPFVLWWLFDYVTPSTKNLPYQERHKKLEQRVAELKLRNTVANNHLMIVPYSLARNREEVQYADSVYLDRGYEGTILRDPMGLYKEGRSTVREGGLLRIKQFLDAEAEVLYVTEGETNQNEAKIGLLGQTERSTHQANMVPNGMVGNLVCKALADVKDGKKLLIEKGQEITVAAGRLTANERKEFWENQSLIIGKIVKFQFFPKGIKDKPRFPTFQSFRDESDR